MCGSLRYIENRTGVEIECLRASIFKYIYEKGKMNNTNFVKSHLILSKPIREIKQALMNLEDKVLFYFDFFCIIYQIRLHISTESPN
jgi:hypothetical protein